MQLNRLFTDKEQIAKRGNIQKNHIPSERALLTLFLLDTANVALLEKRVAVGLPADTGPIIMAATLEATGGLPEVGDDEKVAGGDAGLHWVLLLLLLLWLQGWMWRWVWLWLWFWVWA